MDLFKLLCVLDLLINMFTMLILGVIKCVTDIDMDELLEHPTLKEVYNQSHYNWFGAIFVWFLFVIGLNIYVTIYYIGFIIYWSLKGIHKLFTFGRK